ncbi:MAG: patatin-like phospholipase family protein [Tabrizicola sp.]|uniref:patatin-like phospholipase family protein n=1 Tax=Tabrizicola sp. TaxID=2005166 RepID=UPI002AB982FD|nr:patatin-like phospholipase family protein [Tabrizicola sp.]MDZ4085537.1 patatin-like phospholipase family protein [Tabrizicola sp.]
MRRALLPLLILFGCAPWNQPQNLALQSENAPLSTEVPGDDLYIGLAFSGGGMRATAFAYGMLQELQATKTGSPNGLLDSVRLVSGVSGGSVMAAQLGLKGPQGMQGFREAFLTTDAEAYMTTSGLNPLTIAKGIAGGVNGRDTFGRTLDETLFKGATFADLRRSRIKTWINATDMANNTPFLFSPETFDALCSDLSKVKLSEAVAASAAYPLVFTPIVLEAHQGKCTYQEPDWLTAARYNPEATAAMRAHARALESYTNPAEVKFVKLLDGGITDNFGTTGLAVERARAQVPYAPLTAEEAVNLKRMLFLVANAGVEKDYDWTQKIAGPGGVNLAMSIATSAMSAASRSGYDSMRGELRLWESELIDWRCALPLAEVRRLRGTAQGWDCKDVKIFVGEASFASLPTDLRDQLDAVPTRLKLPETQVDMVIAAGRQATRLTPEFNGFLASLTGNDVDTRIEDGIAAGGRRVTPLN